MEQLYNFVFNGVAVLGGGQVSGFITSIIFYYKKQNSVIVVYISSVYNAYLFAQVLCSAWKDDGTTVFSGGCDKQVKMWPLLSGGQPITVAMHDAPIKDIAWIPEMNLLATGSWDKTIK